MSDQGEGKTVTLPKTEVMPKVQLDQLDQESQQRLVDQAKTLYENIRDYPDPMGRLRDLKDRASTAYNALQNLDIPGYRKFVEDFDKEYQKSKELTTGISREDLLKYMKQGKKE